MHFTPREQEILHLLADLCTRDEMRAILACRERTIDVHIHHLYEKAEVHGHLALARYALEHGYGSRFQTVVRETLVPKQPLLTGKDIHTAFFTTYPHLVPSWHELTGFRKNIYKKVAKQLNCIVMQREETQIEEATAQAQTCLTSSSL